VLDAGAKLYGTYCVACHQGDGKGDGGRFPPVASTRWVSGNKQRLIGIVLNGLQGEIEVEGRKFNGVMPGNAFLSDEEVGGARQVEIRITTPLHRRLILGIDDTDTKEKGATWVLGLRLGREMPHATFLTHKIVQLNPHAPQKTTNCASTALAFAVLPDEVDKAVKWAQKYVADNTFSSETAMASYQGIDVPATAVRFGAEAKDTILSIHDAEHVAEKSGISIHEVTGRRGAIGAVAAIGCVDLGLYSAGLPEDFKHL